jgi:hypothetical protein
VACRLLLKISANGSFGRCDAAEPDKKPPAALVGLACKAVSQSVGDPIRNRQGQAVDAMDEALVKFNSSPK